MRSSIYDTRFRGRPIFPTDFKILRPWSFDSLSVRGWGVKIPNVARILKSVENF